MQSLNFSDQFADIFSNGVKTVVDYQIADFSRDKGFQVPTGNQFVAVPEVTTQANNNNVSPSGQPFAIFKKQDGSINKVMVGGALLLVLLAVR